MKKIKLIPTAPIILAPLILFSPIIFTGKALFWGTPSTQFVPWWEFAWRSVLNGEIPLWNPWVGMGAPLLANYQSALFYPPYFLNLLFYGLGGVQWMARSMTLVVILHLIWSGLGTAKLLENLGASKLGQTVAALAFSLSGYLVARAGFLSINATTAWLPWILLFSKKMTDGRNKYLWLTTLILSMQFFAGHAQTAWYSVMLTVFWVTFWSLKDNQKQQSYPKVLINWAKLIGAGLLAAGISAIQLIPTLEYMIQSQRSAEFGFLEAMTYSFWPWRFLSLFAPDLFGNPRAGNYWGYGNYWEDAVYVGLFPIILAIGTIFVSLKRKKVLTGEDIGSQQKKYRTLSLFLFFIIIISFGFALGNNTFIYPFLYRNIPTFKLFQAPTRFTIWAEISLAILAGIGVDNIYQPTGKKLYATRLAAAGCLAITVGAVLTNIFLPEIETTFISSIGKLGLIGLAIVLIVLIIPGKDQTKKLLVWSWLVIILVSTDLIMAGWKLNPGINSNFYQVKDTRADNYRVFMDDELEYDLKFNRFFKFKTFLPDEDWIKMPEYLLPNLNMLERVEMVNNFDPILPARYQAWMERFINTDLKENQRLLTLMNLGIVVRLDGKGEIKKYQFVDKEPTQIILFPCAVVRKEDDILDLLFLNELDLNNTVAIEGRQKNLDNSCNQSLGTFSILQSKSQSIKVEVNLNREGWVFWSQTWFPGWKGKIDGEPVPIERANYLFQAIKSPQGQHIIEFIYQPNSFYWGLGLTAASMVFWVAGLVISKKKDK